LKYVSVDVEYQSKPPLCSSCNVFGHSLIKCPKSKVVQQWIPKQKEAILPTTSSPSDWEVVAKKKKHVRIQIDEFIGEHSDQKFFFFVKFCR
jgi:hypothetical protein